MSESEIFKGCQNPTLIDQYIKGIKAGARERCIEEIREEVEALTSTSITLLEQKSEGNSFSGKQKNVECVSKKQVLEILDRNITQ